MEKMKQHKLILGLFIIYLLVLTWIILFKFQFSINNLDSLRNINLIPFYDSLIVNGRINFSEIVMNGIIFIPFGIYVSALFDKWSLWKKFLSFAMVSLLYEVLQFVLAIGRSDITDFIENCIGGCIGVLVYFVLYKLCKNRDRTNKVVNILATVGTVGILVLIGIVAFVNL